MMVVSEFVGCSPSLSGAIRVNPWSIEAVRDGIYAAIRLSEAERGVRHQKHWKYVRDHTVGFWARSFIADPGEDDGGAQQDAVLRPRLRPRHLQDGEPEERLQKTRQLGGLPDNVGGTSSMERLRVVERLRVETQDDYRDTGRWGCSVVTPGRSISSGMKRIGTELSRPPIVLNRPVTPRHPASRSLSLHFLSFLLSTTGQTQGARGARGGRRLPGGSRQARQEGRGTLL